MKLWTKYAEGDCLDQLKSLPGGSVDLIVTDPPYGLTLVDARKAGGGSGSKGFMGKKWDAAVPPVEVWRECLRVLKPGAFAFIMSSPRQDCLARMILNLEEAGFVTGFSMISWITMTGFPKATNLSKAADKRAGVEREVVGPNPNHRPVSGVEYSGVYQGGNTGAPNITASVTEEAKQLEGGYAGFQPKPAQEPILVVMKPLEHPTYLDQALDNGRGCTWLDDCRIPGATSGSGANMSNEVYGSYNDVKVGKPNEVSTEGRFPANVLVSDDSLATGETTKSCRSTKPHDAYAGESNTGLLRGQSSPDNQYDDSGSPSRYFDLDAWWAERIGCLPEQVQRTFPNLMVSKPAKREKNAGLDGMPEKISDPTALHRGRRMEEPSRIDGAAPTTNQNHHPTVKPIKLMSYLIVLGSREGDVVLDPYMGSGTTGVAAAGLKRCFLGCELDPEYIDIAKRRIRWIKRNGLSALASAPKPKPDKPEAPGLWGTRR